jgi:molybdopterin synthase sulfur carrier subunit
MIRILYFARLREQLGTGQDELPATAAPLTIEAVIATLRARGGAWGEAFDGSHPLLCALNQEVAERAAIVRDGDEVAFFPPVTGG